MARDDGRGCYEHTFEARLKEDRRKSAEPRPSTKLAQMYPKEKPYQAEQGGWLSLFNDLDSLMALYLRSSLDHRIRNIDGGWLPGFAIDVCVFHNSLTVFFNFQGMHWALVFVLFY